MILEYTGGIPGRVNSFWDSWLQSGFALRSAQVTPAILEEAEKDLDLLRITPAQVELPPPEKITVLAPEATPAPLTSNGVSHSPGNGHAVSDAHVPFETYASRQKSISFFSNLMERWK